VHRPLQGEHLTGMPLRQRPVRRVQSARELVREDGGEHERDLNKTVPTPGHLHDSKMAAPMLTLVWIALAAAGVFVIAATSVVVARALRAWRTFRSLTRATRRLLRELEQKATATEQKAVALTQAGERLSQATARLEESLATLAVLRAAADEARSGVARLRGAVPRK
jgi:hypothetical protein